MCCDYRHLTFIGFHNCSSTSGTPRGNHWVVYWQFCFDDKLEWSPGLWDYVLQYMLWLPHSPLSMPPGPDTYSLGQTNAQGWSLGTLVLYDCTVGVQTSGRGGDVLGDEHYSLHRVHLIIQSSRILRTPVVDAQAKPKAFIQVCHTCPQSPRISWNIIRVMTLISSV